MTQTEPRRGRRVLGLLFLALIIGGAWGLCASPSYRLQRIEVTGNKALTAPEVTRLTGLSKGDLRWSTSSAEIRQRLLTDPWVEDATPTWEAGGVLKVSVRERQPVALLQYHGTYLQMDAEGRVLDQVGRVPTGKLAVITGVRVDGVLRGDQLNDVLLKGALDALGYLKPELRPQVSEIHADRASLTMTLSGPLTVQLGPPNRLEGKIAFLVSFLKEQAGKPTVGELNVENPDRAPWKAQGNSL